MINIATWANGQLCAAIRAAVNSNFETIADELEEKEPVIPLKRTAFNKDFGTEENTVSAGNHTHATSAITSGTLAMTRGGLGADVSSLSGILSIAGGVTSTLAIGTTSGTVAAGNHLHSGTYEPANANIQLHVVETTTAHGMTVAQVAMKNAANTFSAKQTFNAGIEIVQVSGDPSKPATGKTICWVADGAGTIGAAGDVIMASNVAGTTTYSIIFDASGGTTWS